MPGISGSMSLSVDRILVGGDAGGRGRRRVVPVWVEGE
jgi:hypothetical protein